MKKRNESCRQKFVEKAFQKRTFQLFLARLFFLKKPVIFLLIFALLMTSLPLTVLADEISKPKTGIEKETFASLLTDTEPAETLPFAGKGHGISALIPKITINSVSQDSATVLEPARVRKLAKTDYRPNEDIEITIENGAKKEYKTELVDAIGNNVALETEEIETGEAKVIIIEQPSSFRPGKYTLKISDNRGGTSTQDFSWGVLAVNPDKSIYTPGEIANLAFGVLDEGGNMVCDAQVELKIHNATLHVDDSLSTDNGKIKVNPECVSHDFTLKPDYEAQYKVGGPGVYAMTLKSQTKNGAYTITDSFEVRESVPFDVKRITATRIYPPNQYPVTMEITANQDFEGTITETVPASFKISRPGEAVQSDSDKVDALVAEQEQSSSAATPESQNGAKNVQAPDNLPKAVTIPGSSLIGYSTINDLQANSGVKAVLGASVPGLSLPFSGPYPVSQEFGESLVHDKFGHELYDSFGMHGHDGVDFAMPVGTPLVAVDAGKVLLAGPGDYGTTIVLQHSWGRSYYGHLSGVDVKAGDDVTQNQTIGKSGNTGISTGPHLHFGIKPDTNDSENGYYGKVDPAYYLGMKQTAQAVLGVATSVEPDAPVNTDVKILTWKVNVKKGDKIKIGYNYLAPRISPQFYTLGPATFTDTTGKEVFHEIRKWQIASDALEYKFKRGSFTKSTCTATCTQSIAGIGFKPKAIILEWTQQTSETNGTTHAVVGMGLGTMSGGTAQERSVTFNSEDGIGTSDTHTYRSATKVIVFNNAAAGPDTTSVIAAADLVSFDSDGFSLSWTTNNASAYIIHYTALGGADVTNAKAGTFSLTGSGSLAVTDPGFRPDFVTFLSGFSGAADTISVAHAHLNVGFAKNANAEAAVSIFSQDAALTALTFRQQRTDASVLLLSNTGTQDAVADFTSMDATGFTVNISDDPAGATEIYYLALQGGQYDVGSFDKKTTTGEQSVSSVGFRPSGVIFAADGDTTNPAVNTEGLFFIGGASRDTNTGWCNDTTGVQCTTSWTARKKVSFNNIASAENLTDFPVMVKLSSAAANIDFNKTQFNGQDIRFVDPNDPNTVLSHEIEKWDEPGGEAIVWVKVPQIDAQSNTDHIIMYYGNASASDGQDTTGTWNSLYRSVYHFADASGTNANDETIYGHDLTLNSESWTTSGKINGAWNGVGTNWLSIADDPDLDFGTSSFSISFWMKSDSAVNPGANQYIVDKEAGTGYAVYVNTSGQVVFGIDSDGTWTPADTATSASDLYDGTWHHITAVKNGTASISLYVDGTTVTTDATIAATGSLDNTDSLIVGSQDATDDTDDFNGDVDELKIAATLLSADSVEAEYLTGNNAINIFSAEETQAAGGQVYSEGSIALGDDHGPTTMEVGSGTSTSKALRIFSVPDAAAFAVVAEADLSSFDPHGFTLNWTTADAVAQQIIYWAVGSVTASQEDYRWYKNANSITPTTAMQDENNTTILPKNKPYARLRANLSVGGNGLNDDSQGFKLQYASNQAEAAVGGTSDWCNDTTGVTCVAPGDDNNTVGTRTDWCNDSSGVTCDSNWQYRKKITIDNSASTENLTDFPVLVKLSSASANIDFNKTKFGGEDIRFTSSSDATVALYHEVERWNEPAGEGYVWVQVDLTANSPTNYIWMYYGNASASSPATELGSDAHATGVWNSNYYGVWHLNEDSGNALDATTNNGDLTKTGSPLQNQTGKIGPAADFNNSSSNSFSIADASSNHLDFGTGDFSYGLWVNVDTDTADFQIPIYNGGTGTGDPGYDIEFNTSEAIVPNLSDGVDHIQSGTDGTLSYGTWIHIYAVVDNTNNELRLYQNGAEVGTGTDITALGSVNNSAKFNIGGLDLGGSTYSYDGRVDEPRVVNGTLSDSWIKAEYLTASDAMNTFGTEQTNSETVTTTGGWSARKKITFNNASSSANLTNFPVLVKLDSTRIDYSKVQDAGEDLRFVDPSDNTTVIAHEIESWNEDGTSYVWVNVTQIDAFSTSDYIYMYYNNPEASDGQNATGVWESNFQAVWHLKEDPAVAGAGGILDSTSNNNDGTDTGGMAAADQVTGTINGSLNFDPSGEYINVTDSASLDTLSSNITVSAWINGDAFTGSYRRVIARNSTPTQRWYIENDGATPGRLLYFGGATGTTSTQTLQAGKWYYVTMTVNSSNETLYINGIRDSQGVGNATIATDGDIGIGADADGTTSWDGKIDEVRLSNTVRSADWIEAEYLTMSDQMNSFSQEQPYNSSGATVAGWTDVADIWCNDASGVTCNTSWTYRKRITIDNQSSTTALSSFPILVKLDSSRIDYSKTQDDGDDLRFVDPADPATALNHEIETWNENGESYVWVEVPTIDAKSTSDSIWMYYGNASVSSPATQMGNATHETGTWDSSFQAVWHLEETSGTTNSDSTANTRTGTKKAATEPLSYTAGKVSGAQDFDGTDDYVNASTGIDLSGNTTMTVSAWVDIDAAPVSIDQVISTYDAGTAGEWWFGIDSSRSVSFLRECGAFGTLSTSLVSLNTKTHITGTYDGTSLRIYINGVLDKTAADSCSITNTSVETMIGAGDNGGTSENNFDGVIDEGRVSNTARSGDWVKAEYLTSSDQMNTYGAEESQTTAAWRFKDNASVTDKTTITASVLGTSTSGDQMSYQESNITVLNPTALAVGEKREFDFSLDGTNASNRRTYYFRIVNADGTPLTNYTRYPSIHVGIPHQKVMRGGKYFYYKQAQPFTF